MRRDQHNFKCMYDMPYESMYIIVVKKSFKVQNSYFTYLWTDRPQNGYSSRSEFVFVFWAKKPGSQIFSQLEALILR